MTISEYKEAQQRFLGCLLDVGIEAVVETGSDGSDQVGYPASVLDDNEAAIQECSDKWYGPVESMYNSVHQNPNNVAYIDALAACFVWQGLVPEGFTGDDLRPLIDEISTEYSVDMDGNPSPLSTLMPGDSPTLPGGVLLDSQETADCFQRPYQAVRDD